MRGIWVLSRKRWLLGHEMFVFADTLYFRSFALVFSDKKFLISFKSRLFVLDSRLVCFVGLLLRGSVLVQSHLLYLFHTPFHVGFKHLILRHLLYYTWLHKLSSRGGSRDGLATYILKSEVWVIVWVYLLALCDLGDIRPAHYVASKRYYTQGSPRSFLWVEDGRLLHFIWFQVQLWRLRMLLVLDGRCWEGWK